MKTTNETAQSLSLQGGPPHTLALQELILQLLFTLRSYRSHSLRFASIDSYRSMTLGMRYSNIGRGSLGVKSVSR